MSRHILHLPSNETYNRWAPTYDTDGNILQSLDSLALSTELLPRLLSSLKPLARTNPDQSQPLHITDLGCGTGRATLALINCLKSASNAVVVSQPLAHSDDSPIALIYISGLDASEGMLNVARSRIPLIENIWLPKPSLTMDPGEAPIKPLITVHAEFRTYDIHAPIDLANSPAPANAIICALVIEHLPSLSNFFSHLIRANLIKSNGLLVLTNMHPDMAKGADPTATASHDTMESAYGRPNTGAGFNDPTTNSKVRTDSYSHTIADVVAAAQTNGFELVGNGQMVEMSVEGWMLEKSIVDRNRGEKWVKGGVRCWFGGLFRYVGGTQGSS
ncbi:MAG: hypothetical protein Q9164_003820 [Protoblastenia rupestris]